MSEAKPETRGSLRRMISAILWPFRTGYPDRARSIVQGPIITDLIQVAYAHGLQPHHVLNAGAGEGLFSRVLLDMAKLQQLVEFDICYDTYKRKPSDSRQRFLYGSLTQIPVEDGWSDLVLCSEVLEHVQEDRLAVRELARVIAPNGWLVISVPTPPAPFDPAHVREGYELEELKALLSEVGLTTVASRFCMHGAFKALLSWWRVVPWIPNFILPVWAHFDRLCPLGKPMDMALLCRRQPL